MFTCSPDTRFTHNEIIQTSAIHVAKKVVALAAIVVFGAGCSYNGPELESSATGNYKDANYDAATNTVTTHGKIIKCTGSAQDGPRGHDGRLRTDESTGDAYVQPRAGDSIATLVGRYVSWADTISFQEAQTAEAKYNNIDKIGILPSNITFVLHENCALFTS